MDTETKFENELEAMGFQIDVEADDGVSEIWITNGDSTYAIRFYNRDAHVSICGTNKVQRCAWYASALRFIIKHHKSI
tara:strand:+ start:391 stop:624 length:234 start_codon:yes stop_codon:yes gene_type:complete